MTPDDFVLDDAYRHDVKMTVAQWCRRQGMPLNEHPDKMSKMTMARVVTEMKRVDAFFKLEGVRPHKLYRHALYSDHRAARIPPAPPGKVADLIRDKDRFDGIEVGRFRHSYSNPDQVRLTEDDER